MAWTTHADRFEAGRRELAAEHDTGALDALRDAVDIDILNPRLGGEAYVDWQDALANLAEEGWHLRRAGT